MKIQCSHIPRLMIECKIQNGKTKFTGDNDNVKIIEVTSRTPDLIDRLLTVWEDSVRKREEQGWENACSNPVLSTMALSSWPLTSRTRRLRDFMNTWASKFTKERILMSKEILIRFYI